MSSAQVVAQKSAGPSYIRFSHRFHPTWCSTFLDISRDRNTELHNPATGIVQGVAIYAAIGEYVSMLQPGYQVVEFSVRFLRPIRVGDTVDIFLAVGDPGHRGRVEATCDIKLQSGKSIFAKPVSLVLYPYSNIHEEGR